MFTDNLDFYPTPVNLANRMVTMIDPTKSSFILEPSAGKGDLVEALQKFFRFRRMTVHCIEKDPELQATLIGKKFNVIDSDFLAFQPSSQYRTILMNPPFSEGVKHVLKAWDMLYDGDVIALLNAETLKNPCSFERKRLVELVAEFGEVEYLQEQFLEADAERKTPVEVALVKLTKVGNFEHDFFKNLNAARPVAVNETLSAATQLAIPENRIENAVADFNAAIELKKKILIQEAELSHFQARINSYGAGDVRSGMDWVISQYNEYVDTLRGQAWGGIARLTEFQKAMTSKVQDQFNAQLETVRQLEFTTANIRQFLINLLNSQGSIMDECFTSVFDLLTMYHKENRVHIEGWKSNDSFFVKKRCVLPYACEPAWSGGGICVKYEFARKLDDISKCFAILDGKQSSGDTFESHKNMACGVDFEFRYFKVRFYKKGTAHITFTDLALLQKLNLRVGQMRQWLPKESNQVPKAFWLLNAA